MATYAADGDAGSLVGNAPGGPRHNPLTPHASGRHFLGAELRVWRHKRELSVAELARRVYVSRELLQKIETAQRRASPDLIHACDTALDTAGALGRLLDFIEHAERVPARQPQPTQPAPPNLLIRITAELVPSPPATDRSAAWPNVDGLARIYPLGDRRRHRIEVTPHPPLAMAGVTQLLTAASVHPHDADREALDRPD
jgi:transcriptional regulator with XRE-family HTH domain